MSVLQALSVVLLVGVAQAHDWGWGICPRADPVQNLSVDKFMGLWYVIEQFDTSSSCLTLNYSKVSDTQLKVTKARQFYLLDAAGLDHTNSYTGSLDIPDGDNQGKMRVKWPLSLVYTNSYSGRLDIPDGENQGRMRVKWPINFAGKGDYIVIDTDYTGYAGIYECQRITSLAHRQSATILSRTPTLNQTFVDRIKRRLRSFDIDDDDFDKITHESCISKSDSDLNINVDENTFKKVISGTVEGVKDVANTVADGVRDVADAVGNGATSILAGQRAGDDFKEVVVVNVGNNDLIAADPDAELI